MNITVDNKPGLMDKTDIEFAGRTLIDCIPRYCNGRYMMLEYEYLGFTHGSIFIVAMVKYEPIRNDRSFMPLAMFALQSDAMAWIHRRGEYNHGNY